MGPFGGESLLADGSGLPFPWWILLDISVSVLVGMWLLSSAIAVWMMGLPALLARYPPVDETLEESFHFASGTVHKVSLLKCLYVGIGRRGVHLAPPQSFGFPFYRDVPCIPWSELSCVRFQDDGRLIRWFRVSQFKVPALGLYFWVRGDAGRAIEQKLLALSAGRL